ncbi:MAG: LCP family protein [Anaerolineales bacterium]|nr:LCP family protein [Anaerolineales bacterium]
MKQNNNSHKKPSILLKLIVPVVFLVIAVATAYVVYAKSHDFWLSYDVTALDGFAIQNIATGSPNAEGTPAPSAIPTLMASGATPQPWDGASRVTVLVMGLDYRDWEKGEGPPRTDTMILMTIDPLTKTAGMLNIPRDLWVNIPGFEYGKINTAYSLGESYQVPGGGPALARETVELLLGVPIQYYAQVDFYAFERFINELGGIYVDVPEEIKVDPIGEHNTVVLEAGRQLLDGPVALAYARARNTEGGDFDRATRQQQVVVAIRDRALELGVGDLLSRAPALYEELAAGIHTDMPLDVAIQLSLLALEVPMDTFIRRAIAPPEAVLLAKSPDGTQDILKPVPDKIRLLRDEVFASASMASPAMSGMELVDLMQAEGARIIVLNGTLVGGLAGSTQAYLQSQGANVVSTGDGEYTTYTRVIDYTGNPYTTGYLVDLMSVTPYSFRMEYNPASDVDVVVIVGDDWAANNPMP